MDNGRINGDLRRDLYVMEDENNPRGSQLNRVLPCTILDQVYDDQSPSKKTLREILEELKQDIITGGRGSIIFPVTSVNNQTEDVILTKKEIGLPNVDNTRDIDKPLSSPQRNTVMDILSTYDFKVNLDDLYKHIMDTDNPHNVTVEQINKNNQLEVFVKQHIGQHNYSQYSNIHPDLRGSLRRLWVLMDHLNATIEDRTSTALTLIDEHLKDEVAAHKNIFDTKENLNNKAMDMITDTNKDHIRYPSTRAVHDFVTHEISEFNKTLPPVKQWIDNIEVIENRASLPRATANLYRKAYIIRQGSASFSEFAICIQNIDGISYSWNISSLGSYGKYDPAAFIDTTKGLSINMDGIIGKLLEDNGIIDRAIGNIFDNYHNKDDMRNIGYIFKIDMMPGTVDGTFRYFLNNDTTTMSDDIRIAGLQRLAFMEFVTENEIFDNAVQDHHICNESIQRRHLTDEAILPKHIHGASGTVVANITNDTTQMEAVPFELFADMLRPMLGGAGGGTGGVNNTTSHVWYPGTEYSLGNGLYGMRFKGTISCIANQHNTRNISTRVSMSLGHKLVDAGGAWITQTGDDEEWGVINASNTTTYAFVRLTKQGLWLETLSTGNRIKADYDIWITYIKTFVYDDLGEVDHESRINEILNLNMAYGLTVESDIVSAPGEIYNVFEIDYIDDTINTISHTNEDANVDIRYPEIVL